MITNVGQGKSSQTAVSPKHVLIPANYSSYYIENNPRWKCQKCSEINCFKCRSLNHDPKTCLEYQREIELDPDTLALMYSTTKACPNRDCRKRITKREDCKDMHCKPEAG